MAKAMRVYEIWRTNIIEIAKSFLMLMIVQAAIKDLLALLLGVGPGPPDLLAHTAHSPVLLAPGVAEVEDFSVCLDEHLSPALGDVFRAK
jgi:hypothetical protein